MLLAVKIGGWKGLVVERWGLKGDGGVNDGVRKGTEDNPINLCEEIASGINGKGEKGEHGNFHAIKLVGINACADDADVFVERLNTKEKNDREGLRFVAINMDGPDRWDGRFFLETTAWDIGGFAASGAKSRSSPVAVHDTTAHDFPIPFQSFLDFRHSFSP